jgi:hypothetical protein
MIRAVADDKACAAALPDSTKADPFLWCPTSSGQRVLVHFTTKEVQNAQTQAGALVDSNGGAGDWWNFTFKPTKTLRLDFNRLNSTMRLGAPGSLNDELPVVQQPEPGSGGD